MFNFLEDGGNYAFRKVGRYESEGVFISTVFVSDGVKPYETAVAHPLYNKGDMVIVESYENYEAAQTGHNKWIEKMTKDPLPEYLEDCANAGIMQFAIKMGAEIPKYHKE